MISLLGYKPVKFTNTHVLYSMCKILVIRQCNVKRTDCEGSACNAGDLGSISGWEISPAEGNGYSF